MFTLVVISVLVGAVAQRITGMGFALVVSPALILLLGPFDGVIVVNACGAISAALILTRVWRQVQWKTFVLLVIPAIVAIIPGALVATTLPPATLEIAIGVLLVVVLTISLLITRAKLTVTSPLAAVGAGFASGFMNVTAGIGGPAISVYAVLSRWNQVSFAATMQPFLVVVATTSFISKLVFSGGEQISLDWWMWLLIGLSVIVGLVVGEVLAARVPHTAARRAVIVIAYLGGVIAIVHGVLAP